MFNTIPEARAWAKTASTRTDRFLRIYRAWKNGTPIYHGTFEQGARLAPGQLVTTYLDGKEL